MDSKHNIGLIFEGVNLSSKEKERVENELNSIGKTLTFSVEKGSDGWLATCNEIPGIIAGGLNLEPTDSEIKSQIRESILATFGAEEEEPATFSYKEVSGSAQ
jgi:hypothetical protein